MICYIVSSQQVGQQNLFQTLPIQVNISKNLLPSSEIGNFWFNKNRDQWPSPNDPKKTDFKNMLIFKSQDFDQMTIDDTKTQQALRLAKVRPSSKSTPMGSVCPVMDRGEKMERPQLVGTGGTTFDYLQQHLETAKRKMGVVSW